MNNQITQDIINKIIQLELEYRDSKALILSEDDLKCHVFRKIYPLFNHKQDTMDENISGSPLHSEIKFFDENGKLTLIPDITIINTADLSIIHSLKYRITSKGVKYHRTSNKEFEFGGDTIILELKFCKNKSGISKRNIKSYENDINKIKRLQQIVNYRSENRNKVIGIFVVFNKTDKKTIDFQQFIFNNQNSSSSELIIFYGTGHFENAASI